MVLWHDFPCSFKIFINVFAFLHVKVNSKEICDEIYVPSVFRKCWHDYYFQKNACYPSFSLWIPCNSPCKYLLSPRDLNLAQKPLYLVSTVLNSCKLHALLLGGGVDHILIFLVNSFSKIVHKKELGSFKITPDIGCFALSRTYHLYVFLPLHWHMNYNVP